MNLSFLWIDTRINTYRTGMSYLISLYMKKQRKKQLHEKEM